MGKAARLSSALAVALLAAAARAQTSRLWGRDGESWTPESRLPDFSWAGYRAGEAPIPDPPVVADVKRFGAAGDGDTDDTAAFLKAMEASPPGAILIPAGRYKLTGILHIRRGGIVLRGEGEDKTTLFFPKPLSKTVGPGKTHAPGGSWSWSGAYISFEGQDNGPALTEISAPAKRGERRLKISSAAKLSVGQWVRLLMTDSDGSLSKDLYSGQGETAPRDRGRTLVDFASPIASVEEGAVILQRPLRTDIRLEWKPRLYALSPSVRDVGIESLAIEFPAKRYAGHHDEPGFNAVSFSGVSDGWARRLRIINADSGVFLAERARFCTVEGLRFIAEPRRIRIGYGRDKNEPRKTPVAGHHGVLAQGFAQDNLISDFQFDVRFIHELSVSAWSAGNVFSNGRGTDMAFDHHRRAPYENLFTEIQAGEGTRLWSSGGDESDGPHSGARETFWNIRTRRPQSPPDWSVQGNFVGVTSREPSRLSPDGDWWEPVPPESLIPQNLYLAQKSRRR